MMKFVVGLLVGLVLGIAFKTFNPSPTISGLNGELQGWTVISKHVTVCGNPWVNMAEKEIVCRIIK